MTDEARPLQTQQALFTVLPEPNLRIKHTENGRCWWVVLDGHTLACFYTLDEAEAWRQEYRQLMREDDNYGY